MGVLKATLWVKNGPCYFKKMMNLVFSGLTGTRFVYIVIYARSLVDHNTKLREVLNRLQTYRL